MDDVTLRVIDGSDRGRVFDGLAPPITIGREEGNVIQLNDDRISRFHIKIQDDEDKLILTDLDSTNGTKVNGEDVQLRILRFGDVISVGRSVLLFGSPEQIRHRLREMRSADPQSSPLAALASADDDSLEFELSWTEDPNVQKTLHALLPPDLPEGLKPGQAAQVSELIEYLHLTLRDLISSVETEGEGPHVRLGFRQWQAVVHLQELLARYLRQIGDPDSPEAN